MILYGLLGGIVLVVIAAFAGTRDARKKAMDARARIEKMEAKYDDYIKKHLQNHILEENDLQIDADQLAKDVMVVIRPDLAGLISLINSTIYSSVHLDYTAQFFPNLVGLTEEFFRQSQKNKSKRLSEIEEQYYRATALDAIQADIQKRLLDLKIGDL